MLLFAVILLLVLAAVAVVVVPRVVQRPAKAELGPLAERLRAASQGEAPSRKDAI